MVIIDQKFLEENSDVGHAAHRAWDKHVWESAASQTPPHACHWQVETIYKGAFYGTPKVYHSEVELSNEAKASLENWGFKPQ